MACKLFDASRAGLGGCPFAPGASGNVVMEDLCFMLDAMGYDTGVDLKKLVAVRALLSQALPDLSMQGAISRAGLPQGYVAPAERQAT